MAAHKIQIERIAQTKQNKMIFSNSSCLIMPFPNEIERSFDQSSKDLTCSSTFKAPPLPPPQSSSRRCYDNLSAQGNLSKIKLPFPWKLHQLLEDVACHGYDDIVSWLPGGQSFRVHNEHEFTMHILTKYFRQTKYSSFTRQLYMYGFTKIEGGENHGGFFHPEFVQDDKGASMALTRATHEDRRLKKHLMEKERICNLRHGSAVPKGKVRAKKSNSHNSESNDDSSLSMSLGFQQQADLNRSHPATTAESNLFDDNSTMPQHGTISKYVSSASTTKTSTQASQLRSFATSPTECDHNMLSRTESRHFSHHFQLRQEPIGDTTGSASAALPETTTSFLPLNEIGMLPRDFWEQDRDNRQEILTAPPIPDKLDMTIEPRSIEEMQRDVSWQHQPHGLDTFSFKKDS